LVTFAVFVQDLAPPTANHAAILSLLERAEPVSAPPESATNIGDALVVALRLLERSQSPGRRILLISDGEHNVPSEILPGARHPVEAAQLARSLQIPIDTIRIGPDPAALPDPRLRRDAEIGQKTLREVAAITGGIALDAPDGESLRQTLAHWDKLSRPAIERPEYYHYYELYPWLGGVSLLLLVAAITWEWRMAVRVP
jgi:Ca-activated chloride channel family protein